MNPSIKKAILIAIGIYILIRSGVVYALLLLLFFGIIPGTNYSVPSTIMFVLFVVALWAVVFRFTAIEALQHRAIQAKKVRSQERKSRMPRRRYSEI